MLGNSTVNQNTFRRDPGPGRICKGLGFAPLDPSMTSIVEWSSILRPGCSYSEEFGYPCADKPKEVSFLETLILRKVATAIQVAWSQASIAVL